MDKAVNALKEGKMILLHDSSGREDEIDMVMPAGSVTAKDIYEMRKMGGGLICLAISSDFAKTLDLPHMTDIMEMSNETVKGLIPQKTAYGDKPAFSLAVNHKKTFTGITDNDRALTITEFSKLSNNRDLVKNFYAPGHVHLLIAKDLKMRRGHTELSIELAKKAGITEAMVLCEMMSETHNAQTIDEAKFYAKKNNLEFIDGGKI